MLYADRQRAESFGVDAERYERARPGYPDVLVEELLAGAQPDSTADADTTTGAPTAHCVAADRPTRVLDVGCGTGIVGRLFAARGCEVLGVEPDERMARVARHRGLAVEIAPFESWQAAARRFDLLVSGQAWHWIEPQAGANKAASLLRSGGRIALFWNFPRFPREVRAALDASYQRLAPELARRSTMLGNADRRLEVTGIVLAQTGHFTPPQTHTWSWTRAYTTELWIEQLLTHSDHLVLAEERRVALLDAVRQALNRLGGGFEMTYETRLVTARRR